MADKTILSLVADSPATEPYNGTEAVHADQGGTSVGLKLWMGVQTMTGSATVTEGCSRVVLDAASGTATVPDTFPNLTRIKFLKIHASAGTWSISRSGTDTIDGGTSITISEQYQEVEIEQVADGVWRSSKVSGLPTASLPLDGSEMVAIDRDGAEFKTPLNQGVQTMTGSATLDDGCWLILLDAASGTATVPTTVSVGQDVEFIKIHASAGTWTGASSGSETFAGAPSFTLTEQYERQVWTKVTSTRWERKLWSLGAQEYEVGTWTPQYIPQSGSMTPTYAIQDGRYRIVGDMCQFWAVLRTDALTVGIATGSVSFSLPVTSSAIGETVAGAIGRAEGFGGDMPSGFLITGASPNAILLYRTAANGASQILQVSDLGTGSTANSVWISGAYRI